MRVPKASSPSSDPLSLWVGVRVPKASSPSSDPLRPPLPLGEGWGEGAQGKQPGPLSLWERVGVRVPKASSPSSDPLSLWERVGVRVPKASSPSSDPLSLWERVGVRVPKSTAPPGTARNGTGRAVVAPSPGRGALTRPSATLSQRERG